jgi:nucleotide-binding universal stress UspA family protein
VAEPVLEPAGRGPLRRRFGPDGDVTGFLEQAVQPLREQDHPVATVALYDPISPVEGVLRFVRERPAVLLVVGSRLRSGLPRSVFGSVAASIVRNSPAPVLLVPLAGAPHRP